MVADDDAGHCAREHHEKATEASEAWFVWPEVGNGIHADSNPDDRDKGEHDSGERVDAKVKCESESWGPINALSDCASLAAVDDGAQV